MALPVGRPVYVEALVGTVTNVKTTRGFIYNLVLCNPHASENGFVQLFNAEASDVTLGTDTPAMSIQVLDTATGDGAVVVNFPNGVEFDTAISWAATTTAGGNTAVATGYTCNAVIS